MGNSGSLPSPPSTTGGVANRDGGGGGGGDNDVNEADGNDKCQLPCFSLFGSGLPKIASRHNMSDPMGSPMPDTPIFQRKRRHQLQQEMQHAKKGEASMIFSSKYGGLEKERLIINNNGNSLYMNATNGNSSAAGIYEGPLAEQMLHEKYQLEQVLGVGSTSTVHRCIHKKSQQVYACKIIDVQMIEERFQGMMEQFQTEIQALRELSHPGIIQLYDVYIWTGHKICIVMEHCQGGELFDYVVEKGTLTEKEASQIVQTVTSALVYMHSKNIVHRDLKPENLLLKHKPTASNGSGDIDVKIIDFGLSKAMEEPVARTFLGTRGYLAPEMLQRRDYTRAVDAWALGVIVFVLVCGCLPFDDDSSLVPSDELMIRSKFTLRFPRWAHNLSAPAKDLLQRLLDTNPRTRYTAEQASCHPWVQGGAAPKQSVLASPGKIMASPALNPGSVRQRRANRKYHQGPICTPPENSHSVRNTSL